MSSTRFSRMVANRYLWSKRSEAFITIITVISILGVAIGVMVLTVVMSIMTGFQEELRDKILGATSHVLVRSVSGSISDWKAVQTRIQNVDGVQSASPFTYQQALIRNDNRSSGVLIRGIERDSEASHVLRSEMGGVRKLDELFDWPEVEVTREDGTKDKTRLPALVVGRELARNLSLYPGTTVSILSPETTSSPFGVIPRFRRFVVVGTYAGLVDFENTIAYTSLDAAQSFFSLGDTVSGFEVFVKKLDSAPQVSQKIVEALGGFSQGFYAQDWTQTNKPLWDALKLEQNVYFIVLLLIIVMASFSIITTLIMIVLEKRKDIAVLMALGASRKGVARIFTIQGAVIGGIGTILGLILGVVFCLGLQTYGFPLDERIFQMSSVPVRMKFWNFVGVGAAAFLICILATIYPARRASGLEPSEVLRY